jgi:hypothetical protein
MGLVGRRSVPEQRRQILSGAPDAHGERVGALERDARGGAGDANGGNDLAGGVAHRRRHAPQAGGELLVVERPAAGVDLQEVSAQVVRVGDGARRVGGQAALGDDAVDLLGIARVGRVAEESTSQRGTAATESTAPILRCFPG